MERVIFCKEQEGGLLAVFPSTKWDKSGNLTCYSPTDAHGPCSKEYFCECEVIENPKEYLELKNELLSLGYQLSVLNEKPNTILRNTIKTR